MFLTSGFSGETRYTRRDHRVEAAHCRPGQGQTWAGLCLGSSVGPEVRGRSFSLHARRRSQLPCRACELLGRTESLVHFSPGYLDKFSHKKIKLNGSSQTWYQMKGMAKTLKKSLMNMGSRVDHLAVGPISNFLKPG